MWIFGYGSLVWKADFPYVKKVVGYVKGYDRKFWQASIDHRGVPEKPGRVVTLVPSDDPEMRVWGTAYKIHCRDVDYVVRHLDLREVMGYEKVPVEFHPIPKHPMNVLEMDSLSSSYSSNLGNSSIPPSESPLMLSNEKLNYIQNSDSDSGHSTISGESGDNEGDVSSKSELSSDMESDDGEMDEEFDPHYEAVKIGRPIRVIMYFGSETNEHFIGPAPLEDIAVQIFECSGYSGRNRDYLYNLAESMREICDEALDPHLSSLEQAVRKLEKAHESNQLIIENEDRLQEDDDQLKEDEDRLQVQQKNRLHGETGELVKIAIQC